MNVNTRGDRNYSANRLNQRALQACEAWERTRTPAARVKFIAARDAARRAEDLCIELDN